MIDTHVHVVAQDRVRYPLSRVRHPGHEWVDRAPGVDALLTELDDGDGALTEAVLVQPSGAYGTDNSYTVDAAASDPRLAAVAIVDMTASGRAAEVERLIGLGIRGLRLFSIPTPAISWLDDPATDEVWELVADAGAAMGVCVLPPELDLVARVARRHRDQMLVLDHCGFDELTPSGVGDGLIPLAELDNVVLKVTSHVIDHWVDAGWPLDELFPSLADRFGASRLVWGSDFAQTHDRSHRELVKLGEQALDALRPADRQLVADDTARRLWF